MRKMTTPSPGKLSRPKTRTPWEETALLRELLGVPAPSGREEALAGLVRRHLDGLGFAHETDGAGNVVVRLEGRHRRGPLCLLAAHMDEVGLVVTRIEEDGSLRVDRSGRVSPHKLGERPVVILGDFSTITGVLSFGTGHSSADGIAWSEVRVITGLSVQALRQAGVRPGSTGVPTPTGREPTLLGDPANPLLAAWTLDDRAGVAVLLELLARVKNEHLQPPFPTLIAFTVHEEGGCHGAKILAHRERPEIFLAIDGCPWSPDSGIEVDDRPVAWSKDVLGHYDQKLVATLARAARAAGTELQVAVLANACSDASAVYASGAAPRVGILGHARYNSHGFEVARWAVFSHIVETLLHLWQDENW